MMRRVLHFSQERPEMVSYLFDLMRCFELCFPIGEDENEKRWLMPELHPRFQPPLVKEWLDPAGPPTL
jgi:hypothetical protein